ncbi:MULTISPECIES: metal-dependent transcriptional regulator [Halobacterium]|uniref:metal-dependent transcriptional regulator n=1 Tax=Halobacterium TaxID=2239 RepID=UPI00073F8B4E|nr:MULTISPECIES: metal-dependent transcriptional regulator [Halobacterium]MCG1001934.1 metal-dependent transcriptional regulator [Halobacterium noricense]
MSGGELSKTAGRYLSAILLVSAREERPAKTGEVADRLGVDPSTVTERVADFAERGLVDYERYEGATLTGDGEAVTRELMWKQCLVENFTGDDLGLDGVDSASIGDALSEDAARALKHHIDHPCTGRCSAPDADFAECCPEFQVSR